MVFGTFCVCGGIHVFLLFQETCGKTLEEMGDIFDNESIWAFKVKDRESRLVAEVEQAAKKFDATGEHKALGPSNVEVV
jgi:hypothetical protein